MLSAPSLLPVAQARGFLKKRVPSDLFRLYEITARDIFAFAEWWGFKPSENQQKPVMEAVMRGDPRIAVRSGQGTGKTALASFIGIWRAWRRFGGMTVVTAPTARQCRDIHLAELNRHISKAPELVGKIFRTTGTACKIFGGKEWARDWGVKTATATKAEDFQGFHEPGMTIIIEEGSGVELPIWTTIKGTLSNVDALLMTIGNPNTLESYFYRCFSIEADEWTGFRFSAAESPFVNPENIERLKREFGEDSDEYRVRVLGEFPLSDPSCVMGLEDVFACMRNDPNEFLTEDNGIQRIALDFSRFGGDESVIVPRKGASALFLERYAHREPEDIVDRAFALQEDLGWTDHETEYIYDAVGLGDAFAPKFRRAQKRFIEFKGSQTAVDSRKYKNRATEAWFSMRFRHVSDRNCALPDDHILAQQLSTRMYDAPADQFVLETKKEYKKRGYPSPDRADAITMAFYPYGDRKVDGQFAGERAPV